MRHHAPARLEPLEPRRLLTAYYVDAAAPAGGTGGPAAPFRTIQAAVNAVAPGDTVNILPGSYTETVTIQNKAGTAAAPILIRRFGTGEVRLTSAATVYNQGVVNIRNSDYVTIDGLTVYNGFWSAFEASSGSDRLTIQNCRTLNNGASSIHTAGGQYIDILNNVSDGDAAQPGTTANRVQEIISIAGAVNYRIIGNEVKNGAMPASGIGGEGICNKGSRFGTITYNRVYDTPGKAGIYAGAYAADASDCVVAYNVVYNCAEGINIPSEAGGLVNNYWVHDNLVYDNRSHGINVSTYVNDGPRTNITINNNTVYRNGWGSANYGGGIQIMSNNIQNIRIFNNLAAQNRFWQIAYQTGSPEVTFSNNLVDTATPSWRFPIGTVVPDLRFADPAGGDFRLRPDSPAVGAGLSDPLVAPVDLQGNPRVGTPDLGAYEYYPAAPTILTGPSASPVVVDRTTLSATATDDLGPSGLTYTWSAVSLPANAPQPTFTPNASTTSSTATAVFSRAGTYTLQLTVTDTDGNATSAQLSVTVAPLLTALALSPAGAHVAPGATLQYTLSATDQFGQPTPITTPITWSVTGAGNTISPAGLLTASGTPTAFTVTASIASPALSASVTGVVADENAPTLLAAASRKTHGTSGTFSLPLSLTAPSIEPRFGGATTLVFTLSEPLLPLDGSLSANEFALTNVAFSAASLVGTTLTLTLSSPAPAAFSTVRLQGLTDLAGNPLAGPDTLTIGNLLGDADRNGTVTAADQSAVRANLYRPLSAATFLFDLDCSGFITIADQRITTDRLGTSLPLLRPARRTASTLFA